MEGSQVETEAERKRETRKDEFGRKILYPKPGFTRTANGRWGFRCRKEGCRRVLHTANLLKLHMANHKKEKPNGGEAQNEDEEDQEVVVPPVRKQKPSSHCCIFCSKFFWNNFALENHIRTHIHEEPFPCKHRNCEKTFSTASGLKDHLPTHSKERPHKCLNCEKRYKTPGALNRHMMDIHPTEKSFKHACSLCDATFQYRSLLEIHLETHKDPLSRRRFECPICDSSFTRNDSVQAHVKRYHNPDKPVYKCSFCRKAKFISEEDLQQHKQTHVKEKQFRCAICDTDFVSSDTLATHLKSPGHIKAEKGYKMVEKSVKVQKMLAKKNLVLVPSIRCNLCKSTFSSERELSQHENMVHDLEFETRPYCCQIEGCGKAFKEKGVLKRHVDRVHLDIRKYSCTRCEKKYRYLQDLKNHNSRHPDCGNVTNDQHSDIEHLGDKTNRKRKMNNKNQSVDPKNKSAPKRLKLKGKTLVKARTSARLQNKKASN